MAAKFTDIPYPAADADAANKKYVDDQTGGGGGGGGIPAGGTTGQQLTKTTSADFDVEWAAAGGGGGSGGLPVGGTTGQQLTKTTDADFDVEWAAAGGGGGGTGGFRGVNHQTGAFYNVLPVEDKEKLITLNHATPVSVKLPATSEGEQLADSYDVDATDYQFVHPLTVTILPFGWAKVGQAFTCNIAGFLTRARFMLKRLGTPTGNAVAKLYTATGTYGTNAVPGTLLATSDNLDVSTVSTSGAFYDLNFSTPYAMVAGTHYVITIEYTGPSDSQCITVASTTVVGHDGNFAEQVYGSSIWDAGTDQDFIFYVYVTGPPIMDDTWVAYFENLGAGLVTISTQDSAIDGIPSLYLIQDTGIIIACDGSSYYTCRGLGVGSRVPITLRVSGSNFTTTSASLVNITGLSYAAAANTVYELDIVLRTASSSTDGIAMGINYSTSGATLTWVGTSTANGLATPGNIGSTTLNSHGGSFTSTNTKDGVATVKAILTTAANAGNITVQILKQITGTATVYIGSRMTVTKFA